MFGNHPIEGSVEVHAALRRHLTHHSAAKSSERSFAQAIHINNIYGAIKFPCRRSILPTGNHTVAFGDMEIAVGIGLGLVAAGFTVTTISMSGVYSAMARRMSSAVRSGEVGCSNTNTS